MLRAGCALLLFLGFWSSLLAESPRVDFNRDIRPLLSNTCYKCHGPDEGERKAGLRLDLKDEAQKTLESGVAALVPGKLDQSELYRRLVTTDETEKMPPASSGKTLTPEQIELFKAWIEQGADWREHWSFIPAQRPEPPTVADAAVRNPIDAFIRARLAKEGLASAPEADKLTLLRRVTLDLTGLPPTPAEIDAFIGDHSSDAYERVVDRLLKSPRYGEHMARYWLDAARYGDTHGLHLDNERGIWPYRDWVIGAFNRNLPFDQFTIEQLAGDQLPNATLEQKIATGFVRCNVTTGEGGSIDEEFYVRYAVDRVETMGTVWMGLTLGCAVCHSHKYDPITMRDFYQLYAFFNSLTERAMDGNVIGPPPVVKVASPEQQAQMDELFQKTLGLDTRIREELAKVTYVDPLQGQTVAPPERADFVWIEDDLPRGAKATTDWQWVTAETKPVYSGKRASTRMATGLSQHVFENAEAALRIGEGDKLFAYVWLDPQNPPREVMLQFNDGTWEHRAYWGENLIDWGATDSPSRRGLGALPKMGEWVRLEVTAEQVGLKPGAIVKGWAFTQFDGTTFWDQGGLNTVTPQAGGSFESLLAWEALQKAIKDPSLPKPVQDALALETDKRSPEQHQQLLNYFIEHAYAKTKPTFDELHAQRKTFRDQLAAIDGQVATTMILEDMPQRKEAFVLVRGQYDQKGEKVTPGTPAALPPLAPEPDGKTPNRLSLAKWLVRPDHPLTARVAVNRYWQQYFGTGLVETSEDFGAQGQWPSHPELLDWLATEFVASGWNVKHLQKLIVTSATYRQSSKITPESYQKDRTNRLLSRGPRFRLDAEVIRDTALFTSGLLVEKVGGRSVKPYQPAGLWEAIGFTGSNTANFVQDHGEALYRRSVYTFWKRTSPPASLSIFDAPSREACVVRRSRTNTPMHALVLMNDVQYVEASRAFAQRILKDGGDTVDAKMTFAFRSLVTRPPRPDEVAVLVRVWQQHVDDFQADPEAAKKLIAAGESPRDQSLPLAEHAAWSMIANLLLNLSESVTKG